MLLLQSGTILAGVASTTDLIITVCGIEVNDPDYTEVLKTLYQGSIPDTLNNIYTVPSGKTHTVRSIHIANTSTSIVTGIQLYLGGLDLINVWTGQFSLQANCWCTYEDDGWTFYDQDGAILENTGLQLTNIDGGSAISVYLITQDISGGGA
jgi:hypothetical protein